MIDRILREVVPADGGGPVLLALTGFPPDDRPPGLAAALALPAASRVVDLDRHDDPDGRDESDHSGDAVSPRSPRLDSPRPGHGREDAPAYAVVVLAVRTSTDLRRVSALARLLPDCPRMVIAVAQSPPHRPLALPAVAPQWRRLRDMRVGRRPQGHWWLDLRFSAPMPVGDVVAATVRGLDGGGTARYPAPAPTVAVAGPGAADWRPGDLAAEAVQVEGPAAEQVGLPPADMVVRTVGPRPAEWNDPRVVAVDRPAPAALAWNRAAGRDDVRSILPWLADVSAVPPVDERSVNPAGFVAVPTGPVAALTQRGDRWAVVADGDELVRFHPSGAVTDADVAALRPLRGLRIEWGRHSGPLAAVRVLAGLAAAGVPLVSGPVPRWARALGEPLTAALAAAREADLDDELRREEHSIRLRRAALRTHGTRARTEQLAAAAGLPAPDPPRVSVLLCTRRPEFLPVALAQIGRQRGVDLEVVVTLHGVPAASAPVRAALAAFDRPVCVVEAAPDLPFGSALNLGARRAGGRYLAKWDDDDWYGPDHLADMLLALSYSRADLVGGLSQLVYLEQIDRTVLRRGGESERLSGYLSGGTLVVERSVFAEVGGFRPLHRHVDSGLLRAVSAAGGRIYRTHGLGYLLHRRASGHTWTRPVTHFLRRSTRQWKGFRPSALMELDELDEIDGLGRPARPARAEDIR